MMATAIWVTLADAFGRRTGTPWIRASFIAMAAVLAFLVGLSRISLSVHWPTDVLAGWAAGAAWSCLCWLVARALQRRGRVEDGE